MAWAPMQSGRMRCPRPAEVDVERCFKCVEFRDLTERRGRVGLTCSASGQPFKVDGMTFILVRQPMRGV